MTHPPKLDRKAVAALNRVRQKRIARSKRIAAHIAAYPSKPMLAERLEVAA